MGKDILGIIFGLILLIVLIPFIMIGAVINVFEKLVADFKEEMRNQ